MPAMKAHVWVMPKRTVLDPQGQAIQHALSSLGFSAVQDVRQGKIFVLDLQGVARGDAEKGAQPPLHVGAHLKRCLSGVCQMKDRMLLLLDVARAVDVSGAYSPNKETN